MFSYIFFVLRPNLLGQKFIVSKHISQVQRNPACCKGYTVISFIRVSAKFGTCTVVSVSGTLVEDKMRRFRGECVLFRFNKCLIYTHDGASDKFSTDSHETDKSVGKQKRELL